MKEDDVLTFLILRTILDPIFGPKKDKLFRTAFVFRRGMSNAICDLGYIYRVKAETFHEYIDTIPFQYLKTVFAIQYSTLSLTGNQFIFLK